MCDCEQKIKSIVFVDRSLLFDLGSCFKKKLKVENALYYCTKIKTELEISSY